MNIKHIQYVKYAGRSHLDSILDILKSMTQKHLGDDFILASSCRV